MRSLRAISLASMVLMAIGCSLFEKQPTPKPTTPLTKATAEQLVSYLNERAGMLQTVSSDLRLTAHKGMSYTLHGHLAASQPRNFRLKCEGAAGGNVDLGSNSNQFWAYVHVPASEPMYVYASHVDFETGRAKMPGGMPFEPDWVMQALGMHTFPDPKKFSYAVPKLNPSDRTYTLSWQATTPSGLPIQKEVVFDADKAAEGKPQVKKHLIRSAKDNKVICSAEVKSVQTVPAANSDPRGGPVSVQCPTHIVLKWEQQNVELDLMLSGVQVNNPFTDDYLRRLFTRPENVGAPAYDLSKVEFTLR